MATKKTTRKGSTTPAPMGVVERIDTPTDPVILEEVQLTTQAGDLIREFMRNAVAFFTQAKALETEALTRLEGAKKLEAAKRVPKNAAEDEALQVSIKTDAAIEKRIEEHWTITSTLHQLHKRTVARRKRGADAAAEAKLIRTKLHNQYVAAENERTRLENERRRLQAEQVEQARRQKEQDDLEAEALKLEEAAEGLSDREARFVEQVVGGMDASRAAAAVGYKDGFKQAARLLTFTKIREAIEAGVTAKNIRQQAAAVAATPMTATYDEAKPDISTAVGRDRTTHGGEVTDEQALIDAVFEGKHGIPRDVLQVNRVKLNEYGRSMKQLIDRWPGARYTKKTGLV